MATSDKRLVLIHGRGPKPAADDLAPLWRAALRRGVERDHGKLAKQFDDLAVSFVHFGDLMAPLRAETAGKVDPALDLADLRTALAELSERDAKKLFRSEHYLRQKGRSGVGKLLMMLGAPVARGLRMDEQFVAKVSPELAHYRSDAAFAEQVRGRLLQELEPALARGEDVMLVAHCFGSVVAYDCLWLLSRGEGAVEQKLSALVTLGSPLANDAVRTGLLGAGADEATRYPGNITHWFNLAAEDDWVCHDSTVANDFAPMLRRRSISRLEDFGIFNLARRFGRPNPHNAFGYLVHPRMAALLADWLRGVSRGSDR